MHVVLSTFLRNLEEMNFAGFFRYFGGGALGDISIVEIFLRSFGFWGKSAKTKKIENRHNRVAGYSLYFFEKPRGNGFCWFISLLWGAGLFEGPGVFPCRQ